MFSREESKRIREEFWTEFGQLYRRKWVLYDTKIKEVQLKFTFTTELAQVSLDVHSPDDVIQQYYTEKFHYLIDVLKTEYLPKAILDDGYLLPEGKLVMRIFVQLDKVNIHNRNHWPLVYEFLYKNMDLLESFFEDFKDFIKE